MANINIGGITVFNEANSGLAGSTTTPVAINDVVLVRLGSIQGTSAGAESVAFENGKIYASNVNGNTINIHQLAADGTLTNLAPINLTTLPDYKTGGVNSVAINNGVLAVAYENITAGAGGYVALFDTTTNTLIKTISVGVLPDQITFTPDGTKLLVANEAEAISVTNNPVGSISIIDMSSGAAHAAVVNTISFDALNGSEAALKAQGLALLNGQSAAADIEPEYITVSADGTRAYVTLQEVNAVAVVDLTNPMADRPLSILPLGTVDRNLLGNSFDASDRDGTSGSAAVNLQNYDVQSLLQPDAIASFSVAGVTYFVTANEGDSRVGTSITDSVRLNSASYVLDATAYPNAAALKADAKLGRLNVLTHMGDTDGDGDYDQIYTLGGRSITIFRQEADGSISKVRETGGEFEAITSALGTSFNANQSTAANSFDTRSDDKGPEPEGVTVGEVNGRLYAFVGLERIGGFMIYDVTDPVNATFVGYKAQTANDLGPEVQKFIAASQSPTGQALLVSGNEISNSVTVYAIQTQSEGNDVIMGGSDAEVWSGRGGNDTINGGDGADTLIGGAGNDSFIGGGGNDVIMGNEGDDSVAAYNLSTDGVDQINLGSGMDTLNVSSTGASQICVMFTSAEVGNNNANDAGTLANQDGGLAVRIQAEDGSGNLVG
ncbi:choice-of-anchor I family protein, partial [Agitococcus lubricus]